MNPQPDLMLLVEDNPSDAELVLMSLGRDGREGAIRVMHDGAEALDFIFARGVHAGRAHEPSPRVIVLDVKLPKVDGLEVLRQVKADPRTRLIPVVMLTSSNIARDIARAYELGANSYVQKPVEFETFRETVKRIGLYWMTSNERPPVSPNRAGSR